MGTENAATSILDFHVSSHATEQICSEIVRAVRSGSKNRYFACLNPHSFEISRQDPLFRRALLEADFLIPDGIGIVLASRLLGGTIKTRITGMDVFTSLSETVNRSLKLSYFFLGATPLVLQKISEQMALHYPGIDVAGLFAPPHKPEFTSLDTQMMIHRVNQAAPDILWIGMTAPKQEKWIYANRDQLDVRYIGPIGAAFEFFAGTQPRCPERLQSLGIEWLYRLVTDPRRLWGRTFISAPVFAWRIIREKWFSTRRSA